MDRGKFLPRAMDGVEGAFDLDPTDRAIKAATASLEADGYSDVRVLLILEATTPRGDRRDIANSSFDDLDWSLGAALLTVKRFLRAKQAIARGETDAVDERDS